MTHRLLCVVFTILVLGGTSVVFVPGAKAAGVNCSYDACIKECVQKGAHVSGCTKWCSDAMTERKNAGQCKK